MLPVRPIESREKSNRGSSRGTEASGGHNIDHLLDPSNSLSTAFHLDLLIGACITYPPLNPLIVKI